jgi:hypothetical protein
MLTVIDRRTSSPNDKPELAERSRSQVIMLAGSSAIRRSVFFDVDMYMSTYICQIVTGVDFDLG